MGKRIMARRMGRGTSVFRAPTHRRISNVTYPPLPTGASETVKGTVEDIVHEPARGTPLALIRFDNGGRIYIPAPEGLDSQRDVMFGPSANVEIGNVKPIISIPEGTMICNVEMRPGDGGKIARASGTYATVVAHTPMGTQLKLPSGRSIYLGDQSDLLQATKRIIEKHQAQTGVDSTEMLSMLDEVKSAEQFSTLTRGKIILTVSLGHVPTGLKMVNGTLHVDGTKTIGIISFRWDHLVDGGGHMFFSLSYDDGVFHGLRDERILSNIENNRESTEPLTEPAPFPILVFAAALPSGAIAIAGLVFFFKKRSHARENLQTSTKLQATFATLANSF